MSIEAITPIPKPEGVNQSTTIKTSKTESPYKIQQEALEEQLKKASDVKTKKNKIDRQAIRLQIEELKLLESKRFSGGNLMTPKGMLLVSTEAQLLNPGHRLRFVNVNAPGRGDALKGMGYERVPESEGGKQVGELALFRIPREVWAQREATKARRSQEMMESHKGEMREVVDKVIRELHDRGVQIDRKRLLVDEG